MEKLLDVCFCSACHSKYERIKKVKSNTTNIENLNTTNTKQSESSLYNNSSNCDSELKFKLFVKNENENILPEKTITTKLVNFEEFKDLIQQWICKINNNYSIVMSNYSLSYKVEHSRTGAIILQDNDDWKEFLKLYKSIITNKIICVCITMNKQIKKRKQELMTNFNSKKSNEPKSKALCISNNNNADKDEMDKADQITKLRQKWECKICNKICYVDSDCHLELTPYQLQM
ncbi:hypothetical protein F8M41_010640 [Gigaspora margarita]|uniref:Uncharacterized protein n=1 Tax=Gigaspora margarita TaxID=4874 RepID=A0A8H3X395_GIGMA|nr:hypothetical protein F8M41_010640 [Gigaspora margarita]